MFIIKNWMAFAKRNNLMDMSLKLQKLSGLHPMETSTPFKINRMAQLIVLILADVTILIKIVLEWKGMETLENFYAFPSAFTVSKVKKSMTNLYCYDDGEEFQYFYAICISLGSN